MNYILLFIIRQSSGAINIPSMPSFEFHQWCKQKWTEEIIKYTFLCTILKIRHHHVYDRTGESTIRTLLKTGYKNLRTGTEAKFRPFVEALTKGKSAVINRCFPFPMGNEPNDKFPMRLDNVLCVTWVPDLLGHIQRRNVQSIRPKWTKESHPIGNGPSS